LGRTSKNVRGKKSFSREGEEEENEVGRICFSHFPSQLHSANEARKLSRVGETGLMTRRSNGAK